MPRPTPDYIPGELRDYIASQGYAGITEYSEHLGLNRLRLLNVFNGKNSRLRNYFNFATFANVTLDELADLIRTGEVKDLILSLSEKHNCSIRALEKLANVNDKFLQQRLKREGDLNGLQSYIEVATALGWSLDKLGKVCLS